MAMNEHLRPLSPPLTKAQVRISEPTTRPFFDFTDRRVFNGFHQKALTCAVEIVRRSHTRASQYSVPWNFHVHTMDAKVPGPQKTAIVANPLPPDVPSKGVFQVMWDGFIGLFRHQQKPHESKNWFKLLFTHDEPLEQVPEEERILASALSVSLKDMERAVVPLKQLDLIHDEASFPSVHIGRVESRYGTFWRKGGEGAGGVVNLFKRQDGLCFAVKKFRMRNKGESHVRYAACLAREYCVGAVLHHPNCIRTLDLIIEDGNLYEIMEYCDSDLFQYIKQTTYNEQEVRRLFHQILSGVGYLHSIGIAHRDLKPENICLSGMNVKIIDFGQCSVFKSKSSDKTKKSRGLCGSRPYIAPEEWLGRDYDPTKVDVWALGIILITLIFHAYPWKAATLDNDNFQSFVKYSRHQQTYPLFKELDEKRRDLLEKMLTLDPKKRPSIDELQQHPWLLI